MLDDYRQNNINEKSFICLDKNFFVNNNSKVKEEEKKSDIMKTIENMKKQRVKMVEQEEFGFFNDSD